MILLSFTHFQIHRSARFQNTQQISVWEKDLCLCSLAQKGITLWSVLLENNIWNYFPDHWFISWNSSTVSAKFCNLSKTNQNAVNYSAWNVFLPFRKLTFIFHNHFKKITIKPENAWEENSFLLSDSVGLLILFTDHFLC